MMRRRKNSVNLWPLLALPVLGTVGWAVRRFISRRGSRPASETIPVSGPGLAEEIKDAPGQTREKSQQEPGVQKGPETETKAAPGPAQRTAAQRREPAATPPAAHAEPVEQAEHAVRDEQAVHAGHALENQPERLPFFLVLLVPFLILPVAIVLLAFHHLPVQSQAVVPGGDAKQGQVLLQAWGCGSCHTIDGVPGADGKIGPALNGMTDRSYIAGHLRNTPDNMIQWIMHPQEISPGTDMPDSGVPESVARDMAAYLYSIH